MAVPSESWFTVEESSALLREIYPNWPDQRGMRPPPVDVYEWLRQYRDRKEADMTRNIAVVKAGSVG